MRSHHGSWPQAEENPGAPLSGIDKLIFAVLRQEAADLDEGSEPDPALEPENQRTGNAERRSEEGLAEEVLCYLHIAQTGRPRPAARGVLEADVRRRFQGDAGFDEALAILLRSRRVAHSRNGAVHLLRLTPQGTAKARSILAQRSEGGVAAVASEIGWWPWRLRRFLFSDGAGIDEDNDYSDPCGAWCVLSDSRIERMWQRAVYRLSDMGLTADVWSRTTIPAGEVWHARTIVATEALVRLARAANDIRSLDAVPKDVNALHAEYHRLCDPAIPRGPALTGVTGEPQALVCPFVGEDREACRRATHHPCTTAIATWLLAQTAPTRV